MRQSCALCPIKTLARPQPVPREEAPAGSPKLGKYGNEESYGQVQRSAEEGQHGIDLWNAWGSRKTTRWRAPCGGKL